VDEANRLRGLLRDEDGQAALESFFEWLVMTTKQKQNFHVLLASSDSFFNLWVERFVGPSRYSTFVLGHLDRNKSEIYQNQLLKENQRLIAEVEIPEFEKVFSVCGCSILLMNSFLMEVYRERNGGVISKNVKNFSLVLQEQKAANVSFVANENFLRN